MNTSKFRSRGDGGVETDTVRDFYNRRITSDDVIREFGAIGPNPSPVIVFDEFDKLTDDESRRLMSHTIKALSDSGSNKKTNLFRQTLLAASIRRTDDEGRFAPADIVAPFRAIIGRNAEISNFQTNLNAFTEAPRGRILERIGTQRAYKYRFSEPKMQPYVIMRGMSDGLLPAGALSKLAVPEQPAV